MNAHAEGNSTTASGVISHAEGINSTASGPVSHAEGNNSIAFGGAAHAQNYYTIANGSYSTAAGKFNVPDSYDSWTEWVAETSYSVGDKVKVTTTSNDITTVKGYVCKTANNSSTFTTSEWTQVPEMNYAEIIGNGTADDARSNARALDWDGNEYLRGDIYVGCNADSTGGMKVATINMIIDVLYPVGSVYISFNSSMPSYLTTNRTWEAITGDYVLKTTTTETGGTYNSAGETGSHTLTVNEIPSHSHNFKYSVNIAQGGGSDTNYRVIRTGADVSGLTNRAVTSTGGGLGHTHTAGMPANVAIYMWKRTA